MPHAITSGFHRLANFVYQVSIASRRLSNKSYWLPCFLKHSCCPLQALELPVDVLADEHRLMDHCKIETQGMPEFSHCNLKYSRACHVNQDSRTKSGSAKSGHRLYRLEMKVLDALNPYQWMDTSH